MHAVIGSLGILVIAILGPRKQPLTQHIKRGLTIQVPFQQRESLNRACHGALTSRQAQSGPKSRLVLAEAFGQPTGARSLRASAANQRC